jgi:two-component system, chemotaxis family, chemotaxis protein CheY
MSHEQQDASLKLPAVLDFAAADGLIAALRERLQSGSGCLRIDAAGAQTLTLPCVQIMLSAMRSHCRIVVEQPSQSFIQAFEAIGLDWNQIQAQNIEQTEEPVPSPQPSGAAPVEETSAAPEPVDQGGEARPEVAGSQRILTIDDSKTMRNMLLLTLSEAGFEVLQAVDGQDGLNVLGKERVDVVITDINMPVMDGFEVIRRMRSDPAHKSTPILVLSTESEAEKRNIARGDGATGWMVKPFDPERLVATVRKVAS